MLNLLQLSCLLCELPIQSPPYVSIVSVDLSVPLTVWHWTQQEQQRANGAEKLHAAASIDCRPCARCTTRNRFLPECVIRSDCCEHCHHPGRNIYITQPTICAKTRLLTSLLLCVFYTSPHKVRNLHRQHNHASHYYRTWCTNSSCGPCVSHYMGCWHCNYGMIAAWQWPHELHHSYRSSSATTTCLLQYESYTTAP